MQSLPREHSNALQRSWDIIGGGAARVSTENTQLATADNGSKEGARKIRRQSG